MANGYGDWGNPAGLGQRVQQEVMGGTQDLNLGGYNYGAPVSGGGGASNVFGALQNPGAMMMGAGVGQLGQAFGLFGDSPQDAASQYLDQIPGEMQQPYDPYIQAGQQELPQLQDQYGQLMQDPGARMQQMGAGFQTSPGYQYSVDEATRAANQAAAAGGMAGTPAEQKSLAGQIQGMAGKDYYNYLDHAMNLYGQGLQGGQGLYNTGFQASNQQAQNIANALASQANLAYSGAQGQQQGIGGGIGGLLSGAADLGLF